LCSAWLVLFWAVNSGESHPDYVSWSFDRDGVTVSDVNNTGDKGIRCECAQWREK
jgi:hypothetical protein